MKDDSTRFWFAEKDPTKKIQLLGYAKKLAHRHAFENAFRRVIILSLDNGKVGVEINQKDIPELGSDDLKEDGIINVNYFDEKPLSDADEEQVAELEELSGAFLAVINSVDK